MTVTTLATAPPRREQQRELPMPAGAFGLLAIAVFVALLLVTFAFRSVSTRH